MAYNEQVADEIRFLFQNAPEGYSEHYLENYLQQDVVDTVNVLHRQNPKNITDTSIEMTGKAPITLIK